MKCLFQQRILVFPGCKKILLNAPKFQTTKTVLGQNKSRVNVYSRETLCTAPTY